MTYSKLIYITRLHRFIGGKKEVAEFESFRQVGPIVKVVPFSMGKGVVIAVLNDPNYEVIISHLNVNILTNHWSDQLGKVLQYLLELHLIFSILLVTTYFLS